MRVRNPLAQPESIATSAALYQSPKIYLAGLNLVSLYLYFNYKNYIYVSTGISKTYA